MPLIRILFPVLALLVLAACGGGEVDTAQADSSEKVLHYGNGGDPKTLDPNKQSLVLEGNIMYELFEGLVTYDTAGDIVPGQAESWNVSEDGLTYTFRLREGLTWSDGHPVTADDFVYSMSRLLNPLTAAELSFSLYAVKNAENVVRGLMPVESLGLQAVDDRTLIISLDKPQPALMMSLQSVQGLPIPRHVVEKFGAD
jgi:oligopeptide transport system substrate-binding protein